MISTGQAAAITTLVVRPSIECPAGARWRPPAQWPYGHGSPSACSVEISEHKRTNRRWRSTAWRARKSTHHNKRNRARYLRNLCPQAPCNPSKIMESLRPGGLGADFGAIDHSLESLAWRWARPHELTKHRQITVGCYCAPCRVSPPMPNCMSWWATVA